MDRVSVTDRSFWAGPDVVARLVVGTLVPAVVFTVVGYVAVRRLVDEFRRRDLALENVLPVSAPERAPGGPDPTTGRNPGTEPFQC